MNYKNKYASIAIFISIFICFVSAFSITQKIDTKDGVRIVHNKRAGKWGKRPKVTLKLIKTIGDIYSEYENFAFWAPQDIALDAEGNMYISDNGNWRIQKFSPEGKYLATIGRRGQGPGEFQSPESMDIDSKGYLYIQDTPARKIHILTLDGEEHKTLVFTKYQVTKVRCLKSGLFAMGGITSMAMVQAKDKILPKLIQVFDLEGNLKYEFGDFFDYNDNFVSWWGNWFSFDVDQDDYFYLSFDRQNRIEKYSPEGKLTWRADRVLNYDIGPMDKGVITKKKKGVAYSMPRMNTVSHGIAVDNKGRSWVLTLNRQLAEKEQGMVIGRKTVSEPEIEKIDAYKLEIFDKNGFLLGEIQLDHYAHGIRIYGNYLFVWAMNFTKYYQYEIIEK